MNIVTPKKMTVLSWLFLSISFSILSQELPPISIYTPSEYGADDQNWDIDHGQDATVYIANNKGLLEFNGSNWKLNAIPSQTIMRSVKCIDDKIFTGSYMEFGFWKRDNYGNLNYTSLSQSLNIQLQEDEEFWDIVNVDEWVLFQSLDRIYAINLNTQEHEVIVSETRINELFAIDDVIYFQQNNKGIYKIENGAAVLAIDDPVVIENDLIGIYEDEDSALLILTKENGFFRYTEKGIRPWIMPVTELLKEVSVYSSLRLKNGNYILGTISNGLIVINNRGEQVFSVNKVQGLSNNTVLSINEDQYGNVWLGLDNGINCLNLKSPYRLYRDIQGKLGTVYAATITEDYLYLGTNQGLFYKDKVNSEAFTLVPETMGQVWALRKINGELFCGHDKGTFLINGSKATMISNEKGTWDVKAIPDQPNVLLQGHYKGLSLLKHNDNGDWSLDKKFEGFEMSSRYFEFVNSKELLVSHEYKGVFLLSLNDSMSRVTEIKKLPVEKGVGSSIFNYGESILYAYKGGVFRFNDFNGNFRKDSLLSSFINSQTYVSGKFITDKDNNGLWAFNKHKIIYVTPGLVSSMPDINSIPIPHNIRNSKLGYENLLLLEDDKFLIGTTQGYLTIDLSEFVEKNYTLRMTSMKNYKDYQETASVDLTTEGLFKSQQNNLQLSFSISDYNSLYRKSYQYRLVGLNDRWSDWRNNSELVFENLPHGTYSLEVRGRVGETVTTNTIQYKFTIQKPWYLSSYAIVAYVFGGLWLGYIVHLVNRRHYRNQKQKLIEEKEHELKLEQLENQRQLMEFKNENLQLDIDNKSRELGLATMNLVKKNELLNDIKVALIKSKTTDHVKQVIKQINVNMNNTSDWKLFEEAFNNVDKEFMKRVKELHPSITPNDLRLCAYLRLNLSSKEIAPLLNISHKSVEVKRYRLRKKMGLDHNVSLSNYIIEL